MPRDPQRRAQLLQAAMTAIDRHGPGVRMEDVAAQAGVTKPVLYRHFGDKGGLYEALARAAAGDLQERLEAALTRTSGPRARLRATIGEFLLAVEERPHLYRFLVHRAAAERPEADQAVGDFMNHFANRVATVIGDEFASAGLRTGDPSLLAQVLFGSVQAAADHWLATPQSERATPDDVRDLLVELLWNGLPGLAEPARPAATGGRLNDSD